MKEIDVWDLYIRVNHWLMALLFTGLILTGKAEEDYTQWHFYMGYLLSALLITRILYGIWGAKIARFMVFIKGPLGLFRYTKQLFNGSSQHYLGHNPLGAIMVLLLLILMLLQVSSGFVSSDDVFWYGPMYEWVSDDLQELLAEWHKTLPDILLGLVACHIFAILIHEIALKERLVKAMLNGKKQLLNHDYQDQVIFKQASVSSRKPLRVRLIMMLAVSMAWLYWLWQLPI